MLGASVAYIFFAFITTPLILFLAHWHWTVRNAGTILIIFWTCIGNITGGITTIIFLDAQDVTAAGWCDFAGNIRYLWGSGCCLGGLILLRRLKNIVSSSTVPDSPRQRQRQFYIELTIGIFVPLIEVPLHYVVQGRRMAEIRDFGCMSPVYPCPWAIILVAWFPLVVSIASAVFGGEQAFGKVLIDATSAIAVYLFMIRRHQLNDVIESKSPGLSTASYVRLTMLGLLYLCLWFPLSTALLVIPLATIDFRIYRNWKAVHQDYRTIVFESVDNMNKAAYITSELVRWQGPIIAIIFFVFFGIKPEVWESYYHVLSLCTAKWRSCFIRDTTSEKHQTLSSP